MPPVNHIGEATNREDVDALRAIACSSDIDVENRLAAVSSLTSLPSQPAKDNLAHIAGIDAEDTDAERVREFAFQKLSELCE